MTIAETPGPTGEPGRLAAAVRNVANLTPAQFRTLLMKALVPFAVLLAATMAVGASSLGRTARALVSAPLGIGVVVFGLGAATVLLGRYVQVGPARFRILALISAVLLAEIIVSGAAVRLTGSGLGCPDWPTCANGSVVPPNRLQSRIESSNRMVTLLLVIIAALCVLAALVRKPYRRDLVSYGAVISALIFGNAIVGGAVVLFHLKTGIVMAHFLLSIASVSAGNVLYFRSGEPGGSGDFWGRDRVPTAGRKLLQLGRLSTLLILIGITMGTVATGSGPHSGDPAKTERLPFGIQTAARMHSLSMWVALLSVAYLAWQTSRTPGAAAAEVRRRVTWLLAIIVGQGLVGYIQYAKQLPAALVELHVLGATLVWVALTWVRAALTKPADAVSIPAAAATA